MKRLGSKLISSILILYYTLRYGSTVSFGSNVLINHRFHKKGPGKVVIGNNCNLWAHEESNVFCAYDKHAFITIGEGSRLNGLTVHCQERVTLGSNCLVGSAIIMDTDFHQFTDPKHILYRNPLTKPVVIGNNVWLCGQSVVLKGSRVGDNSVVGFRAVVAKSFPTDVVIAGNPARVVKTN